MRSFVFSTNSLGSLRSGLLTLFAVLAALAPWLPPEEAALATAPASPRPITLVILPCSTVIKTHIAAQPLVAYLENELGRRVNLLVPNSLEEVTRLVQRRETDFVFQPPHVYVLLAKHYAGQQLLQALTPEGTTAQHGVFVTRRGSGIKSIRDLRNKKVLFGMPFSTAKWIAAKKILQAEGLDVDKDLSGYAHLGSCEAIALGVFLGQGDAGVICDYSLAELNASAGSRTDEVPPGALVAFGTTRTLPSWVFAAHKEVAKDTVAAVFAALTKLDNKQPLQAKILTALETAGFKTTRDSDYDGLREYMKSP